MIIFKTFCFSIAKKRSRSRPKKSAPAQILNRLRLQPKNLGSDGLRNTGVIMLWIRIKIILIPILPSFKNVHTQKNVLD